MHKQYTIYIYIVSTCETMRPCLLVLSLLSLKVIISAKQGSKQAKQGGET